MLPDLRQYEAHAKTVSFQRKLYRARLEIEAAVRKHASWIVSSSWGKDSCALAGLVSETVGPGFDVAHLQSPYELPGCERVTEWFGARCVVHTIYTVRTLTDYVAWLQAHGLGIDRDKLKSAGKQRKTDELVVWVTSNGYTLQMLGMRADESKARRTCFRVRGLTYEAHGLTVSNPLGWWSTADVWSYLVSREIPWHPLYDCETHGVTREQIRNSGWLTVASDATDWRIPWLRRHYPEQYRALTDAFPRVRQLG
jgi:3'-phosphoadenosine 5'-phosphosulfate sulfotransferase (PAPS reductase)/FAD synthetase